MWSSSCPVHWDRRPFPRTFQLHPNNTEIINQQHKRQYTRCHALILQLGVPSMTNTSPCRQSARQWSFSTFPCESWTVTGIGPAVPCCVSLHRCDVDQHAKKAVVNTHMYTCIQTHTHTCCLQSRQSHTLRDATGRNSSCKRRDTHHAGRAQYH